MPFIVCTIGVMRRLGLLDGKGAKGLLCQAPPWELRGDVGVAAGRDEVFIKDNGAVSWPLSASKLMLRLPSVVRAGVLPGTEGGLSVRHFAEAAGGVMEHS
jgi:hypothetical protein